MSNITAAVQINNAVGGIDSVLTEDPETSIFNYVYKRITPFAKHTQYFHFKEIADFGRLVSFEIPYVSELVNTMYLYFRLPPLNIPNGSNYVGYINSIGFALIEYMEIRIGENLIDKQFSVPMEVMDYLVNNGSKNLAHDKSVGRYDNVNVLPLNARGFQDIYVPLQFWFTKKISMSLPLLCTDLPVKINVKLREFTELVTFDGPTGPERALLQESGVFVDYFTITKEEREEFLNDTQKYLIDQWQLDTFEIVEGTPSKKFRLDFRKAVKELVFVFVENESEINNDFFNYGRRDQSFRGGEFITNLTLFFDGKERVTKMPESFFRTVIPQRYHSFAGNRNIYVIPFSEFPEENQPTGTANFSRYDSTEIEFTFVENVPQIKLYIWAVSYNRIIFNKNKKPLLEYVS